MKHAKIIGVPLQFDEASSQKMVFVPEHTLQYHLTLSATHQVKDVLGKMLMQCRIAM